MNRRSRLAEAAKAAAAPFRLRMPDRIGMMASGFVFMWLSRFGAEGEPFFAAGLCLAAAGGLLVGTGMGKRR